MKGALSVLVLSALASASADVAPLRVRVTPAAAPCVDGVPFEIAAVDEAPRSELAGVDVVVGADEELTRILESDVFDPDLDVDVAVLHWVLVSREGTSTSDLQSLAASSGTVHVLGGTAGAQARRALQHVPASRVRISRSATELAAADAALVPSSLTGGDTGRATSIPPLRIRGIGLQGQNKAAARRFLEALAERNTCAASR